jgi:hypothetical protein
LISSARPALKFLGSGCAGKRKILNFKLHKILKFKLREISKFQNFKSRARLAASINSKRQMGADGLK